MSRAGLRLGEVEGSIRGEDARAEKDGDQVGELLAVAAARIDAPLAEQAGVRELMGESGRQRDRVPQLAAPDGQDRHATAPPVLTGRAAELMRDRNAGLADMYYNCR